MGSADTRTRNLKMIRDRQRGFSLLEMMIVLVLLLIIAAITVPKMREIIDAQKLRGSAQAYAGLMQTARTRAAQDNTEYEIQTFTIGNNTTAFVDLNDNGQYDSAGATPEPAVPFPSGVVLSDNGAPTAGFDTTALLGAIPANLEDSPMLNKAGAVSPGLAFNERGLPCQRDTAGAICKNIAKVNGQPTPVAWVTYIQYTQSGSGITKYAAVSVTPAGRIKTWTYQSNGQGGGSWQ